MLRAPCSMLHANQMSDYIIKVENLGKRYRIHHGERERYHALRDVLARGAAAPLRWLSAQRAKSNGRSDLSKAQASPALTASPLPLSASRVGTNPLPLPPGPLPREEEFWALRGVSFEVKEGEVVGITRLPTGRSGGPTTERAPCLKFPRGSPSRPKDGCAYVDAWLAPWSTRLGPWS